MRRFVCLIFVCRHFLPPPEFHSASRDSGRNAGVPGRWCLFTKKKGKVFSFMHEKNLAGRRLFAPDPCPFCPPSRPESQPTRAGMPDFFVVNKRRGRGGGPVLESPSLFSSLMMMMMKRPAEICMWRDKCLFHSIVRWSLTSDIQ